MLRSHKIRLKPNKKQVEFLTRCCGTARFVYNYGLQEWKHALDNHEKTSWMQIDKSLNSVKEILFPWMYDVPNCLGQQALSHLGKAMMSFFNKIKRFPVFKKRGDRDSFTLTNTTARIDGNKLNCSKKTRIKMYEKLRFSGKIMSYTISRIADRWFVSILVETEEPEKLIPNENQVGIDLGIKTFATLSNGETFQNPKFLRKKLKQIKRLNRNLSKKAKGSKNRYKARLRLAKQHMKIANLRQDFLHRITTYLIRNFQKISIEDLNVAGMLKNHCLALAVSDVGFSEFRRQLTYKAEWYGRELVLVNRWFPSSKTCSRCGCIKEDLTLKVRIYKCEHCGLEIDRDLNAAVNICNVPSWRGDIKLVETTMKRSMKQENHID